MNGWFPELEYTPNRVNKAGRILRRYVRGETRHTEDEVEWAMAVAKNFRRAHMEAENWAQMGCRYRLRRLGLEPQVTQRLKELKTIQEKLDLEGNRVQLNTMEDICGVRVVVPTIADLRAIEESWVESSIYPIERHRDKITDVPKSGYRAVHLVIRHKGRLVEIQLRTKVQHAWAELVEELSEHVGTKLKGGQGPPSLLLNLRNMADSLAALDVPDRYSEARTQAIDLTEQFTQDFRRSRKELE